MDREESPWLHPDAADALVMAARTLAGSDAPRPVAVVLEDGTLHTLEPSIGGKRHARGRLSGPSWTFWWERRSWAGA